MAATLVANGGAYLFGHRVQIGDEIVDGSGGKLRVVGHSRIQVVHVGLVMLVVVQMHGLGVDVWLERVVGVRKCRQSERAGGSSRSCRWDLGRRGLGPGATLKEGGGGGKTCRRAKSFQQRTTVHGNYLHWGPRPKGGGVRMG